MKIHGHPRPCKREGPAPKAWEGSRSDDFQQNRPATKHLIQKHMATKFDYAKAIAELEEIAKKVENPETKLDDIDALVNRSKELLKGCREYLRTVKDRIDSLDKE